MFLDLFLKIKEIDAYRQPESMGLPELRKLYVSLTVNFFKNVLDGLTSPN